jgi:histidine triad (HIT) family protein
MECLFCKIARGEVPATIVYQDETCVAFSDIDPRSPVHLLVVPREHIPSLAAVDAEHEPLLGHLLHVVSKIATEKKLTAGFRVVVNTGVEGGQTLPHLHLHLLGGRAMHWPPG